MGYSTDFYGSFEVTPPLKPEHSDYLLKFSTSRRMQRDPDKLPKDHLAVRLGLGHGAQGGYYVDSASDGNMGQNPDASVLNHNAPPSGQPGLWCQWIPSSEGNDPLLAENVDGDPYIVWDEGEKFYNYVPWIEYLIEHFLKPWGYVLNGEVEWKGEDSSDLGKIVIKDNTVTTLTGSVEYR